MNKPQKIPEAEVVRLWQERLQQDRHLMDSEGQPVEVVYPGRLNDSRGGDFRDAVVTAGSTSRSGDIEIHTWSSGWQAHGHKHDPAYNRVVLHVALESTPGSPEKTVLQNGETIPTILLNRLAPPARNTGPPTAGWRCRSMMPKHLPDEIGAELDAAGDQRFELKASALGLELTKNDAGQALYAGVAEALGYSKNKVPFRELARRVPLNLVADILIPGDRESLIKLQSLLIGEAGLLPSQRKREAKDEAYVEQLEEEWQSLSRSPGLTARNWELFKVRPGNYPVRRIIALSYLLYRFHPPRWPEVFLDIIRRTPPERVHRVLEAALLIPTEDYWTNHYDFGRFHSALWGPVLLGGERASEITINVLLPFSLAWTQCTSEEKLESRVRGIYSRCPPGQTNAIERHMIQQLALPPGLVNSARRQQGLLHIYKTRCIQGRCGQCNLAE